MTTPAPRRLLWLLAPVAAFAATLALLTAVQGGGGAAPRPVFDRPGPATVDVPPAPPPRETIAATRAAIEEEPGDAALHATLGDLYYQRGRETADSTWNEKAHDAYRQALALDPDERATRPPASERSRSPSTTSPAASATASRRSRLEPESVRPYAAIVDGQVELGRYADARTLARPDGLAQAEPRLVRAHLLLPRAARRPGRRARRDAPGGVRRRRLRRERGLRRDPARQPRVPARRDRARRSRRTAPRSRAFPDYLPAQAGLATVEAAQGDLDAAIERYEAVVETSAVHEYHLLLLEAKLADGRPAEAREDIAAIRENQAIERSERRQHRRRARDLRGRPRLRRARRRARPRRGSHRAERVVGRRLQLGADRRRPRRGSAALGEAGPADGLARPAGPLPRRHGGEARRGARARAPVAQPGARTEPALLAAARAAGAAGARLARLDARTSRGRSKQIPIWYIAAAQSTQV